jgi:hypothetical protein
MKLRFSWGTGVALSYLAFAGGTMAVVIFALHRPVDLVAADYYAQSLRQDAQADAERNARLLGAGASIVQTGDRAVLISLPQAQARDARGSITLYRASDAAADRVIPLQTGADGRQRVPLAGLQTGQWSVRVRWTAQGRAFYFEQRVFAR